MLLQGILRHNLFRLAFNLKTFILEGYMNNKTSLNSVNSNSESRLFPWETISNSNISQTIPNIEDDQISSSTSFSSRDVSHEITSIPRDINGEPYRHPSTGGFHRRARRASDNSGN